SMQTTEIAAGAVGGAVNVNAMSAGLASGAGKAGALKGFANGKGTQVGSGNFGGKNFDMSLGGDEAEAVGGLDKSLIAAVVQANIGQIKHCYERQLIVDPNIFGKVVAAWTINKDGLVSVSSIKNSTMNSKPVENCIAGKIKAWAFPKPQGGGQVLVSYPFMFKSLN
ncbi:MAG: AgmX/PglI C-terminal domain-containing protein, partial [Proteobacteria bacterium]